MDTRPPMIRMPSLDSSHTTSTTDSAFSSTLMTPGDEQSDNIAFAGLEPSGFKFADIDDSVTPKPKHTGWFDMIPPSESRLSFRKVLAKAKSMTKGVVMSPRRKLRKRRPADANAGNISVHANVSIDDDSVECPDMGDLFSDDELSFASLPAEPNSVPDLMELLRTPTQEACFMSHPVSPSLDADITVIAILDRLRDSDTPIAQLTFKKCIRFAVVACLIPLYSVLVGACILLAPSHIDKVAFRHGLFFSHAPQGLARFSHWAYCAYPHVFTFIACLVYATLLHRYAGILVAVTVACRFYIVWSDFHVDKSIPLGMDDRQSIFLVITNREIEGGQTVRVNGAVRMLPEGAALSAADFI